MPPTPAVSRPPHYERSPSERLGGTSPRFPPNHVDFALSLRVLGQLEQALRRLRVHPKTLKRAVLEEFDRASPHDAVLGTPDERGALRRSAERYASGIDGNPNISGVGHIMLRESALASLRNRTALLAHYAEHKEHIEANGRFEAPLIITGSPRTGTTLLQRLIAEDPNTRSPRMYELRRVLPPLGPGADPERDPRIEEGAAATASLERYAPGMLERINASHFVSDTEMEESLLYTLAHNGLFTLTAALAGRDWVDALLREDDKLPVFRYEALLFKVLDAARPVASHWTLKAPSYAMFFSTLMRAYPRARVVLTHRSPLATVPSLCRLWESICLPFNREGTFDKVRFGQLISPAVEACFARPFAHLEANPGDRERVMDCMYEDLVADPIAMVHRVYDRFGLEVTPEFERRMETWLRDNRQGKHGRHRYSLAEYGLDATDLYTRHRAYMQRHGFEPRDP